MARACKVFAVGGLMLWCAASFGVSQVSWFCLRYNGQEICPGCPGEQVCLCFYTNAPCLDDIVCNTRPKVETGLYDMDVIRVACYSVRGCASQYGGPCDPVYNPCVPDDVWGTAGEMDRYSASGLGCAK